MGSLDTISILGCGWLGKPLAMALIKSGYRVLGSTTKGEKISQLTDAGIEPFLIRFSPDLIENGTSLFFTSQLCIVGIPPALGKTDPGEYLAKTRAICNELINGGVSKVIFISSTSVYYGRIGIVQEGNADETSPLFKAEMIFKNRSEFVTTVIRFAGLVGPERHPSRFLSGKTVSGGNDPVNLVHLTDCIGVIQTVIERNAWGRVFNACADIHPTRREFYTRVCAEKNVSPPVFVNPENESPKIVSNAFLRRELDYSFVFSDPMKMTY